MAKGKNKNKTDNSDNGNRTVALNRRALYNYEILERYEAGMVLTGSDSASIYNHEPRRSRKLLLHKSQIRELASAVSQKGLTLVALRLYVKQHVAKIEIGLARGKRQYDKRQSIIERELDREAHRALR